MAKVLTVLPTYQVAFDGTETQLVLDLAKSPFNVEFSDNLPSSFVGTIQGTTVTSSAIAGTEIEMNFASISAGTANVIITLHW